MIVLWLCCESGLLPAPQQRSYLCKRSRSDVKSTYSDTFRPVMSTRMSPVTTFMRGGLPPTPLGQEKPVPCMEQVHRTGSWRERGRTGEDVTGSKEQTDKVEEKLGRLMWQYLCRMHFFPVCACHCVCFSHHTFLHHARDATVARILHASINPPLLNTETAERP